MKNLVDIAKSKLDSSQNLPFSIYSCKKQQNIRCVPILKPILILVLKGEKKLGFKMDSICKEGQFIFLSENSEVTISNIPSAEGYMSLFIEFEYSDFDDIRLETVNTERHIIGEQSAALIQCITQFIEWSFVSPREMWELRRKELVRLLYILGYKKIASMVIKPQINHKLIDLFRENPSVRWSISDVGKKLAMSESTLRRKLRAEGTNFSDLHIQVRLGYGIHLLQTTNLPVVAISEKCGYQSQSRFTEKFRERFGITPVKLRKTKLND